MTSSSDQHAIPLTFLSRSSEDTKKVGESIADLVTPGEIICLTGELGAGKTTLIKGLIQKITGIPSTEVVSPTFSYLNIYPGPINVYHFDLYRLSSGEEFLMAGFHEFLEGKGICCIEWPERLPGNLKIKKTFIHIEYLSSEERQITLRRHDEPILS